MKTTNHVININVDMMKIVISLTAVLLTFFFISPAVAQQIYTWTDEKGVLHMTNEPPPQNVKVDKVTPYKERSPAEERQIERRHKQQQQANIRRQQQDELEAVQLRARQAEEEAQEAIRKADDVYQQSLRTIEKYNNYKSRRKQFKKRIQKAKDEADAAQAEAKAAAERAKQAAEAAQIAKREARKDQRGNN